MNDTIRSFLTLSFASALCVAHAAPAAAAVTGSVDVTIDGITIDGDAANPNGDRFGYSLAAGDVNGDGHRDLVVGATKAETVYVFLGPITEPLDTTKASGVYHGFTGGEAGWSLAV
ncbi:MAG: FG-GAP repeat protein, partial [Myxococcales bacterium]|nr:FG-GAP repeat protein [Myxococcales bacterium]